MDKLDILVGYLVTNSPGTVSEKPTSGLDNKFDNFDFTKEESESGYKNFVLLNVKLKVLSGYISSQRSQKSNH